MNEENMSQAGMIQLQDIFRCPKCQADQERGELCNQCGLIFEKYLRAEEERAARIVLQDTITHPHPGPSKRSFGILVALLIVLSSVICWRIHQNSGMSGTAENPDTPSEKNDPNLLHNYVPYSGTVVIKHDRDFMTEEQFNGPTLLDAMDMEQIAAYRKEKVLKYAQLNFFHQGYDPFKPPHNKIYGQITPKVSWITTVPYYIANPYLLLSLTHDNAVAPFTVFLDDFEITYSDGKLTETHTGKNGMLWKEFVLSAPSKQNVVQVIMANAWDAGFYYVHLVESQSENVVPATTPDNIGRTFFSQSSFYHVGQHQKNNISPYDARGCITLKDVGSPTRLVFHLWRNDRNRWRQSLI